MKKASRPGNLEAV